MTFICVLSLVFSFRTFEIIAGIASILPVARVIIKYVLLPLKVQFSAHRLQTLQAERAYLRTLLSEIDALDRASYWEDIFYTPIEAAARKSQLIPPEFTTLKTPRSKRIMRALPEWPNETSRDGRFERHKNILTVLMKYREPLVILGDPGAGKSVAFRHAIRQIIKHELRWYKTKPKLPIYIQCSHYTGTDSASPVPVNEFVESYLSVANSWRQHGLKYDSYLKQSRLIFLFDALDEMPRQDYIARLNQMNQFIAQHGNNRIFFSCRLFDYDKRLQIKEVYLRPFDSFRWHTFIKKQLSVHFSRKDLRKILYDLETDPKLAELLANPFFCQLVSFYIQTLNAIPTNRFPLFSIYVDRALQRELERRASSAPSKEQTIFLLSQLAYLMSEKKGLGTAVQYDDAIQMLCESGVGANTAKEQLALALSARLLVLSPENKTLRFSHHRFQEYFSALYVSERIPWDRSVAKQLTDDPWWREIFLMLVGMGKITDRHLSEIVDMTLDDIRALLASLHSRAIEAIGQGHSEPSVAAEKIAALRDRYQGYFKKLECDVDGVELFENLIHVNEKWSDITEDAKDPSASGREIAQRIVRVVFDVELARDPFFAEIARLARAIDTDKGNFYFARQRIVSRFALVVSCTTIAGIELTAENSERICKMALVILKCGNPLEQVSLAKQVISTDDITLLAAVYKLLSGRSKWAKREVFQYLWDFRMPLVGFEKRVLLYLWQDIDFNGIARSLIEYQKQLIRPLHRTKILLLISGLTLSQLAVVLVGAGLLPWVNYLVTQLRVFQFEYVINPYLVTQACIIVAMFAACLSVPPISGARETSWIFGLGLSVLIWFVTVNIYNNRHKVPAKPLPHADVVKMKVFGIALGLGIAAYILTKVTLVVVHVSKSIRFRKAMRKELVSSGGVLSAVVLLQRYEQSPDKKGKLQILGLLQQCATFGQDLNGTIIDIAAREPNADLADGLWQLAQNLEARQLQDDAQSAMAQRSS